MAEKLAHKVKEVVDESFHVDGSERPQETNVTIRSQPKRIPLPDNVMVFQAFAEIAAQKLKASTCRILMLLFAQSAYENYVSMDIQTIADALGMSTRSVITGLNELHENNIILKLQHPSDKRRHDYFMNPVASWKGNSYTRKKMMSTLSKKDPRQLDLFGSESKPE